MGYRPLKNQREHYRGKVNLVRLPDDPGQKKLARPPARHTTSMEAVRDF